MYKGKLRITDNGMVGFWCLGCKQWHFLNIENPHQPKWDFNGDYEKPTFTPSVLVKSGHYANNSTENDCWCNFQERFPEEGESPFKCGICHSFITNGQIQYLGDCTHELVGQTVELILKSDS